MRRFASSKRSADAPPLDDPGVPGTGIPAADVFPAGTLMLRTPVRVAVLASGGGSNLEAILAHLEARGPQRTAEVVLVASDRIGAGALEKARARSVNAVHLVAPAEGPAVDALLQEHDIGLIALAGYLRLVPAEVTRRFRGRMINVHPGLLPAFGGHGLYGLRVHRAVLEAGAAISGATIHFVDEVYDRGPIIAQWPVPVAPDDTPESLATRVLGVEHALYPRVLEAVAAGQIRLGDDNRVHRSNLPVPDAFVLSDRVTSLGQSIDRMLASTSTP
jgi:formyltetrahydrofolate-dependent phosphoribosylglycinamide formyltransferase